MTYGERRLSTKFDYLLPSQSYAGMRESSEAYYELRLDNSEPVEIADLAAFFAGIGGDFDRYLERERPELKGEAKMFVRQVKDGSVIAEIFASISDMVGLMDAVLIVGGFGALFNERIKKWVGGKFVDGAQKPDLKNALLALRALAKDKNGEMQLTHFEYKSGVLQKTVVADFNSAEAQSAVNTIEQQKKALDSTDIADRKRVLMTFKRMDKDTVEPGKGTGERVLIESIDARNRPVFYGSELAAERVKSELTNSEYPFRLGFVVDVNVATKNDKVSAYSVKHVHDVIELDE